MKNLKLIILIVIVVSSIKDCFAQSLNGLTEQKISTEELGKWTFLGLGEFSARGSQLSMKEAEETKGVMLVSPKSYKGDVVLHYKVLALTPATVLTAILSASDEGESSELTIPENYDGSLGLWFKEKENYFFAFKSAPHGLPPYVKKNPNSDGHLALASKNSMIAGVYYNMEVGRRHNKLWLSIDGNKVFEVEDKEPLQGGHIALRIRGTAGFEAGCLIKDLVIFTEKE